MEIYRDPRFAPVQCFVKKKTIDRDIFYRYDCTQPSKN